MRDELCKHLDKVHRHLTTDIDPDHGLFGHLLEKEALNGLQVETCQAKMTASAKMEAIITLLKRQPDTCYFGFCDALAGIGRPDIVKKHLTPEKFNHFIQQIDNAVGNVGLQLRLSDVMHPQGIAVHGNRLYVVCHESNVLLVFGPDTNAWKRLGSITIDGLRMPGDVVACAKTRRLYIPDCNLQADTWNCVWRIQLDYNGDVSEIEKWLPKNSTTVSAFRPISLSVRSGRVLVASWYDRKLDLLLYDEDGVEQKCTTVPETGLTAHAIETSRGSYILLRTKQPRIREVSGESGAELRACNSHDRLGDPHRIVQHPDGGFLVADADKGIWKLSSNLQLQNIVVGSPPIVNRPTRLCYDENSAQLFISGWDSIINAHVNK